MGRLNYINRKCEGLKLGEIIHKDLSKRIPPASGSKAALRDPVVEIDVSNKALTNDGFAELAAGLVESLTFEHGKVVRLEELCLKGNELGVSSLRHLGPVIKLACNDLRDLDLSNNSISIHTRAEAAVWEDFLLSFSQCCVLRRIDLSGNALDTKALEVLARVYSNETPLILALPDYLAPVEKDESTPVRRNSIDLSTPEQKARKTSVASGSQGIGSTDDEELKLTPVKQKGSRHGRKSSEKSGSSPTIVDQYPLYATTHGLRSVPYIVFSDCSMDESSALHLSYILANHYTPERLLPRVPPAKAGPSAQQLALYDKTGCRGIIYLPNSSLTSPALKALELSEAARTETLGVSTSIEESQFTQVQDVSGEMSRRASEPQVSPVGVSNHRRQISTLIDLDVGEPDPGAIARADLDRARSRIQGNALQDHGQHRNDLWGTALEMLTLCRDVQPQDKPLPPGTPPVKTKPSIIKTLEVPGVKPKKQRTLSLALGSKNPNLPMPPRSDPPWKKGTSIPPTPTVIPPTPQLPPKPQMPPMSELAVRIPGLTQKYRSKLPCGLPEDTWRRIMGFAVDAGDILSDNQQRSVLKYAMDRSTLRRESESLGLKEATQIWRILEGMDCLAYEMRG